MKQSFIAVALAISPALCIGQTLLPIPDTLSGTAFDLTMHKDSVQFLPGAKTNTMAFNAYSYLGPTLIMQKGANISITVNNEIGDTTTVHWHGLHIPPQDDGGPHTPIMPGETWNPEFEVMNSAATYWYHPHFHGKTALHAMRGAAGMIIIRDGEEAALSLPRTYGVDDIPLIVQSQQLDPDNQIDERGMVDSIIIVNGKINTYKPLPAQVVRLRLLNAAGERNFNFGFSGNKSFSVIGNDNGLLPAPVSTTRLMLSPGERAEVLLDLSGMNGQTLYLMSYATEIPMGVQGGPTMPMPEGSEPMNSSLNGVDFNILQINVTPAISGGVTAIPATLVPQTPWAESSAMITRTINFTADSEMVMDGPFYFNDSTFDMMRIDYKIPLNNIEIWEFTNHTMVAHPFHIHDVHFFVLDRDGNPPPMLERGRKDVVLVKPDETVRVIMKFEHFADSTTPYMYHCHVLMHEDDGMMGQFLVMPATGTGISTTSYAGGKVSVYPNPGQGLYRVRLDEAVASATAVVYNETGMAVWTGAFKNTDQFEVDIHGRSAGSYLLRVVTEKGQLTQKITLLQ